METNRVKLSEQIRRAIDQASLTRYAISKATGISQPTLSRFMSGERGLPMNTLDQLANFLDLNIGYGPGYPAAASKSIQKGGRAARMQTDISKSQSRQRTRKAIREGT